VQLAASPPLAASRLTNEPSRGVGRESLLDKARHIRADQERHGTRLTGKTLAEVLRISDGYARRLLREINSGASVTT
jgi:hypothetical protein